MIQARKPQPASVAYLAMSACPETTGNEQLSNLVRFADTHAGPGEMERIYLAMMAEKLPPTAVEMIARAVATWGTARPYVAVVTLAVMTGHHWRMLHHKLIGAGIPDPLELPSMHALLDYTEAVVVDNIVNGDDARTELASFYRRLYGPTAEALSLNGEEYRPPGFTPDEVEASFDAFARAAR